MVDGLVITENIALFEELNINFSNERNHFEYANSADSAKELIALEIPDYLIIFDKSVEKVERVLKQLYEDESIKRIPTLCFLSSQEWMKRGQLWHVGVRDIIQLPITKMELKFQLDSFISEISDFSSDQEEAGMFGKLEDYNLLDLIQTLENSRKTGVLVLYRSREEVSRLIQYLKWYPGWMEIFQLRLWMKNLKKRLRKTIRRSSWRPSST